jgi:hypothetical protein
MNQLIDEWHVCPYEDNVDELFASFKHCVEAYLATDPLTTKTRVNIVQDLRTFLNPHENKNLAYFTDIICDTILSKFHGIERDGLPLLLEFIQECEEHVYLKL